MTRLFLIAPLLLGASGIYLYVVAWSFRASERRVFKLPWLLLPLGGALLAGIPLALNIPATPASPVSLRLLELLAHLCNILLIWTIAGKIAPTYRLAGTWLYAWNPLVLIELAAYANTAGIVTCMLLLAVTLLIPTRNAPTGDENDRAGRRPQGSPPLRSPSTLHDTMGEEGAKPLRSLSGQQIAAFVLVGLALRINFMTLLLAPLLLWFMVRDRRVGSALGGFAWRALMVLGIFVIAYLPDWRGSKTFLVITNGIHLFDFAYSPLSLVVAPARALFTFVAQRAHFPPLMQPTTAADMTVLATSFFVFALLYLREMGRVRATSGDARRGVVQRDGGTERVIVEESRKDEDRHKAPAPPPLRPLSLQDARENAVGPFPFEALFTGWAVVVLGYIVLAATVFLPGYIAWGVWVVSLRRFDTLSVCVLLLSCSALLYYPLQWFALASTGFLLPLGVFGIPLVYLAVQSCLPTGKMKRKKVLK